MSPPDLKESITIYELHVNLERHYDTYPWKTAINMENQWRFKKKANCITYNSMRLIIISNIYLFEITLFPIEIY